MELLAKQFRLFAARECRGSSELYGYLAVGIADNPQLLQLALHAKPGQPIPNMLLGAVHYLLLSGVEHPLADYYPNLAGENALEPSRAIYAFATFCEQYEQDIIALLTSRLVQTNEVRRCAYLYPGFGMIYELARKPLALIEIGTSAGLQLLWDRYSYCYDGRQKYGNEQSELVITGEIRGDNVPPMLASSPPVISRVGVDLHVNNLNDSDDYLWLRALIWPEHQERIVRFDQAAAQVKEHRPHLVEGNGVELLPGIAASVSRESALCVFHTHVANQFSPQDKAALEAHIQKLGGERDVYHLYNNMSDSYLHLDYYVGGREHRLTLAQTDGHGRWFRWLLS
ncbi:hypothetical protein PCCS19_32360 [Paenibacillus sp. CCS19]|uniref:DUF2332 domain-containing protein n=1 Tax=Paenibacillus sp. CCS19 TaxID=3158387 RepID=UPI00255E3209|nr:DUF2332 domain-containing protein [Paenibacillus cellulosilyticus]GMK40181.1 hypothetical protein PCCS19_32360 [Paenibacillus cellulosilyticus]